jgi:hypothetical protein
MLALMSETPQTYANHTRLIPIFHYVTFPILAANFFRALWHLYQQPGVDSVFGVLMGFAFIIMFFAGRVFALKAQDRVIRLEMRLRMKDVLPASMHPRIKDFTPAQLVALRFASDAELPALAEKVLADNMQDRKAIKLMIKDWQGDYLRV